MVFKRLLVQAGKQFVQDNAMAHAASVAFYTALSFAPLVLLIITFGGLLGTGTRYELMEFFEQQAGPGAAEVAEGVIESSHEDRQRGSIWQWLLSTGILLFTASAVFGQFQLSLNQIWNVQARPGSGIRRWIRKRLVSIGMIVSILFILLVGLVISSVLNQITPQGAGAVARITSITVSLIVFTLLFALMFRFLPDVRLAWRHVMLGAFVTAVLFAAGKLVISLYLERAGAAQRYDRAAASLIALLVWVYYSAIIVFFGAELTQAWVGLRGEKPEVEPHAQTREQPPQRAGAAGDDDRPA
jgi:membrane protein